MKTSSLHNEHSLEYTVLLQIQSILHSLGIPSILYTSEGQSLKSLLNESVELHGYCPKYTQCFQNKVRIAISRGVGEVSTVFHCDHDTEVSVIKIKRSKTIIAYVVCCLQNITGKQMQAFCDDCEKAGVEACASNQVEIKEGRGFGIVLSTMIQALFVKMLAELEENEQIEEMAMSLSQSYDELALLRRINDGMKMTQNPAVYFAGICNDIRDVAGAEEVIIYWRDKNLLSINLPQYVNEGSLTIDQSHLGLIWDRSEQMIDEVSNGILIDSDVDRPYSFQWPEPIRNIVSVPMIRNNHHMGSIVAINKLGRADFNSLDTKLLLTVANEFAVFIENYRLFSDLQDLLHGSLRALTNSVDAKDTYTHGHSERVAYISRHIAETLGLANTQVQTVYLAGLMHDVGKIGIHDSILMKKGRLTDDEYMQIKQHPQIGADILGSIKQMDQIARAVLSHHEWYNGAGYPHGLAGQDIPYLGRVVMLADSFDAMIADRAYQRAMPLRSVLAEIRRYSGTQFDPTISDAFLSSDIDQLLVGLEGIETTVHKLRNPLESFIFPVLQASDEEAF